MNTQFLTRQVTVPTTWRMWSKAIVAAFIGGGANSFLTALGIGAANTMGIQVQQLNPKQLVATTVIGGLVGVAMYLKKSPVPDSQQQEQPDSGAPGVTRPTENEP